MTRIENRIAVKLERKAIRTGIWGPWRSVDIPGGIPGAPGWCASVRATHANDLYVCLERPVETVWGTVLHISIRTISGLEPPWRDKQRIKNELYGDEAVAVEVMPAMAELIDEADMYHMWVLPAGFVLPFTIFNREKMR